MIQHYIGNADVFPILTRWQYFNHAGASPWPMQTIQAVTDFAQSHALKVIPLSGPEIAELRKQQPYYAEVPLPANTYKGQTAAVPTLAVMAVWTAHDAVPEAVAYEVTKALYENTAIMGQVHVQGKNITLGTALAVGTAPMHPGALKYFKEKGVAK